VTAHAFGCVEQAQGVVDSIHYAAYKHRNGYVAGRLPNGNVNLRTLVFLQYFQTAWVFHRVQIDAGVVLVLRTGQIP
jgi:hypothetical protein